MSGTAALGWTLGSSSLTVASRVGDSRQAWLAYARMASSMPVAAPPKSVTVV